MGRILLFLFICPLFAGQLHVPVNAKAALVMNADNGCVLFEKKGYELAYPASTTKIATALFALNKCGQRLDEIVEVKNYTLARMNQDMKEARGYRIPPYWLQPDGTSIRLQRGEKIALEDLLYGLMLQSGNDAANAIADYVSGSVLRFMQEMNLYLKEIGCYHTNFANPHGLHFPSHKTTPYDLARMASVALQEPTFRKIVLSDGYLCQATNKSEPRELVQKNELLREGRFHYEGSLGIKTGGHSKAGFCFVAAAEREGRTIVAVLLGCDDKKARYRDACALLDAAFAEKIVTRKLYNASENLFTKEFKGQTIKAQLKEDVALSYFPAEEPEIRTKVKWKMSSMPIILGQKVGELQIKNEKGEVVERHDLIAVSDYVASKSYLIWCLVFLPAGLMIFFIWYRLKY